MKQTVPQVFFLIFFYLRISISINKVFNLSLDSDLDSLIMPKVKTTYAYKLQYIDKNSLTNLWNVLTINYIAICVTAVSCNKRFLVDSRRNTSKHQKAFGSRSENLIPPDFANVFKKR